MILFLFFPLVVFAHGDKYLELNPDRSNSLKDADVAIPSQIFFAQNDFLGGFDLWLANLAAAGIATFSLINEQGIVLTTKTAIIPTIALTSSGTKFHVDFNSQFPVLADNKYSIQIATSMPELRLYYTDRVQVISHNAPPVSEYLTGVARLGAEEQLFSFKYALYETNETSAPILSNIGWTVVSATQMKIDFNANEAVDYRIEYGPSGPPAGGYTQSTNFLGDYEFCTEGISNCDVTIPVFSDATYQYLLTAKDYWGNQSQATGTFTSGQAQIPSPTPTPTDQPPIISNFRVAEAANNSVGIAWTTNEISNSNLLISFSSDLISITAVSDPTFELEHFLETDPVLSPGTAYLATIRSSDMGANESKASLSFTTLSGPTPTPMPSPTTSSTPPPPPIPSTSSGPTPLASAPLSSPITPLTSSEASSPATSNPQPGVTTSPISGGTGTVNWSVPSGGEPSDGYRVDVFDKEGNLVKTIFVPSGSHQVEVTDLEKEGYSVIVYENEGGVFKKLDKPKELKPEEPFVKRLLDLWPYLLVPVVLLVVFLWLKRIKIKNVNIKM